MNDGLGAVAAVVLIAIGCSAMSAASLLAAVEYSHHIDMKAERIQKRLNKRACADSAVLAKLKDPFAPAEIEFSEFGCKGAL